MPTVRICCPAGVKDGADDAPKDDAVLLLATVGDVGEVPGATKTGHELPQGRDSDLEGLDPESLPASEHAVELNAAATRAVLHNFVTVLESGPTKHNAAIDADVIRLFIDENTVTEDALDVKMYKNQHLLFSDHFALHLPKCQGCSVCDRMKTNKFHLRRRKRPKLIVTAPDAIARPFGVLVHLDHIAMEMNSQASRAARYSLNIHAEQTTFCMAHPSNARETETVLDAMHQFDDDVPAVRRWWTDAALEFAFAARTIRSTRSLDHYKSAPYCPQANGRAERLNRMMIEGTRCFLFQAGLGQRRRPLAIMLPCMNYNALDRGPDGLTPWTPRFGTPHQFRTSPFGVLVLYTHPKDAPVPGSRARSDKHIAKK